MTPEPAADHRTPVAETTADRVTDLRAVSFADEDLASAPFADAPADRTGPIDRPIDLPLHPRAVEVLDALPDEIVVLDEHGIIVWVAAQAAERLGRRATDLIGRPLVHWIHTADRSLVERSLNMVLIEPSRSLPFPCRMLRADGSWFAAELVASVAQIEQAARTGASTELLGHRAPLVFTAIRQRAPAMQTQEVLQLMAAGAAFPTIADALVRLASAEAMGWRAALLVEGRHGRTVFAGTLPPTLFAPPAEAHGQARRVTPWDRALETGDGVAVAELDALPSDVAARAAALGLVGCVTVGVHDNDSQCGALVVWFESGATTTVLPLWLEHEVEPLLRLALEQHQARAQLEWAARFDALTGLPNRGHLLDEVSRTLARCRRGTTAAVLYLDLDGFKAVNDEHGHLAGDEVLVTAAHRLRNEIRPGDLIGRLGGDEFVLVCPGCRSLDEVEAIGTRMIESMRRPITLAGGGEVGVGVSVGAVLVGPRAPTVEDALARADANLYGAKAAGRGCVVATSA